jgi:predicted dinucleotide-binding enzyme
MGSRTAGNERGLAWAKKCGQNASAGTFIDVSGFGDVLFLCTKGEFAVDVVKSIGDDLLAGKVLIDVTNPLDFSNGMPPTLFVSNNDSLGERVQRAAPRARVVKSLNTMNCELMVDASKVKGNHSVFVSGNDPDAKNTLTKILTEDFGWNQANIVDVGDISSARGTEALLLLWTRLYAALGTSKFNFHIAR